MSMRMVAMQADCPKQKAVSGGKAYGIGEQGCFISAAVIL